MTALPANCKVVATSFDRRARWQVLDLLKSIVQYETIAQPGTECDLIVVNNDTGWEPGRQFLDRFDGTPTVAGRIRVLHRHNHGGRYGAFNAAFEAFRGQYEYWLFVPDSVVISAEGYYSRLVDRFNQQAHTGFVALDGVTNSGLHYANGAVGLTRADVLEAVYHSWGSLPHRRRDESQDEEDIFSWGEVLFTSVMARQGCVLVDGGDIRRELERPELAGRLAELASKRSPTGLHRWLVRCSTVLEEWSGN